MTAIGASELRAGLIGEEPLGKAAQDLFMNDIQSSIFPVNRKLAACT
jgi:hypothetical protein